MENFRAEIPEEDNRGNKIAGSHLKTSLNDFESGPIMDPRFRELIDAYEKMYALIKKIHDPKITDGIDEEQKELEELKNQRELTETKADIDSNTLVLDEIQNKQIQHIEAQIRMFLEKTQK